MALVLWIPIMVLMWVIPYTVPDFLTSYFILNEKPLYIFILLVLGSII